MSAENPASLAEIFQGTAAKFAEEVALAYARAGLGDHLVGVRDPGRANRPRPERARRRSRRHRRDDAVNRPEFHLVDAAGAAPRRDAVLDLHHLERSSRSRYLFANAGNRVVITETRSSPVIGEARRGTPDGRARRRHRGARGRHARRSSELEEARLARLRLRGAWRGGRARRHRDADLHLGHHRAAEGRGAHARQPDRREMRAAARR